MRERGVMGAMIETMREAFEQGTREFGALATKMALATLVVLIAFAINRILRTWLQRRHAFMEFPAYGQTLILNSVTTTLTLIAGSVVLALWGATWSAIAAGIGLSTLAIALGLQDVLKSIAGGIVIMLERPFDIGDRIRIAGLEGEVIDMRVRSVVLRMDDNHVAQVPNGLLFSETFENLSRTAVYSYAIVMSGIDDTAPAARTAIREALESVQEFAYAPDIVIQPDLRRHGQRALSAKTAGEQHGESNGRRRRTWRRAVVSWQSESEEASLAQVVECLTRRYPGAQIEIRKR
jgi:small-conductance mechanosensitive channel